MTSPFDEEIARRAREAVQPSQGIAPDPVRQPTPDEVLIKTHSQDIPDWNRDRAEDAEPEKIPASRYEELVKQYRATGNHDHEKNIEQDHDLER